MTHSASSLMYSSYHLYPSTKALFNKCVHAHQYLSITYIRRWAFVCRAGRMRHCPPDVLRSHAISQPLHSLGIRDLEEANKRANEG